MFIILSILFLLAFAEITKAINTYCHLSFYLGTEEHYFILIGLWAILGIVYAIY